MSFTDPVEDPEVQALVEYLETKAGWAGHESRVPFWTVYGVLAGGLRRLAYTGAAGGVLDGTFRERVKYCTADTSGQRCAAPTIWRRGV